MRRLIPIFIFVLLAAPSAAHADAFSWLRSENRNVREGNEKLAAGDQKAALSAYDRAARELPSEGGVHLDRGLALLRAGDLPAAREALKLATRPPASTAVRADAYYDLGTAFYKEADARAGENKHDEAQKLFREAEDAFKQSLRLRPGDRNTAWNHEITGRRIREQEEKQKQQQDKDNKDKQDKDKQDNKDQQQGDKGDQNQQDKDKQQQDPSQQDKDKQKQDQAQQDKQKKDQPQPQNQDQQKKDQQAQQAAQDKDKQAAPRPEVDRALDSLQDSEENLERLRAMNRAARERRKPEKDW